MFNQVQVWTLAEPLKDIHSCPIATRLLSCSVLRVFVLLKGELSSQSQVQSSLERVLIKEVSVHLCIYLSLDPD